MVATLGNSFVRGHKSSYRHIVAGYAAIIGMAAANTALCIMAAPGTELPCYACDKMFVFTMIFFHYYYLHTTG